MNIEQGMTNFEVEQLHHSSFLVPCSIFEPIYVKLAGEFLLRGFLFATKTPRRKDSSCLRAFVANVFFVESLTAVSTGDGDAGYILYNIALSYKRANPPLMFSDYRSVSIPPL